MTPKQRLLNGIKGLETDKLPWSPFLAYFWETQPEALQRMGQIPFLEEIGADPLLRGRYDKGNDSLVLFKIQWKNCRISESVNGNEKMTLYETPVGTLQSRYVYTDKGSTWFLIEHPVKNKEDFKVLTYLNEDMSLLPDLDRFNEEYHRTGERALYLPVIGTGLKTSFQSLVEQWVGTEELVYSLMDFPDVVENCLHSMKENSLKSVEISVDSLAEAFIFWEDSSTTNISPAYFDKYTLPEINAWGDIIHSAGKYLIHHACGHLKALLPLMSTTAIDMIESISPPPTGNINLWEARKQLPNSIGLIGGIEPTVFLNSSLAELENYVTNLICKMKNTRFILANSDSCPPGIFLEKFKLVTEISNRSKF